MKTEPAADNLKFGKRRVSRRRAAFSLLELMVATAMMATLMTSVIVVMRSGYAVWSAQEADIDVLENGYGVLRQFAQQMRQASAVTVITAANNTTGSLTFTTPTGVVRTWAHNGAPKQVYFNNGASNQLLANKIDTLTFTGYKADGVTATTTVDKIQVVQCTVEVTLPRGSGVTRKLSCRAWVRSW
jgi:type II secretory pathway pseudopilin PulG